MQMIRRHPYSISAATGEGWLAGCGVVMLMSLVLGGCISTTRYAGLDLASPALAPDIAALARAAHGSDKQAQLALGIRFENGDGVPRNSCQALMLYQQAATKAMSQTMVYVPGVPAIGTKPSVQRVTYGSRQQGLPEAREKALRLLQSGKCTQAQINRDQVRMSDDKPMYFTDAEFTQATPPMPLPELLMRIVAVAKKNKDDITLRDFMDAIRFEPPRSKNADSQRNAYFIANENAWFSSLMVTDIAPSKDKRLSLHLRPLSQSHKSRMTIEDVRDELSRQLADWHYVEVPHFELANLETFYRRNGVTIRLTHVRQIDSIAVFVKFETHPLQEQK
jgi:hypothetical protein